MPATTDSSGAAQPILDPVIDRFYTEDYDEVDRLSLKAVGRLELERTKELLLRILPPAPAKILDVGGGPGVYAAWLAELGYDVTLVEPVSRHREQAAAHGTFAVEHGDARKLAAPDASADAVLLLGPLYHLRDVADRAQALSEAWRVVRPGGPIAAAFISRHAPIIDVSARLRINDDEVLENVRRVRVDGRNMAGRGFTAAYFHTVEEIHADFAAARLPEPQVFGIEGPLLSLLTSELAEDRPDFFEASMRAARFVEDDPAMLAANAHLLGVVVRPDA
jgi:ubiquinone/menaquinone biosynthesis C-methylase UbiE